MIRLNETEWLVVLNAYLYEVEDGTIMSDSSYDFFSECVAQQTIVNIPGFNRSTGQFIHDLIKDYPKIKLYAQKLKKTGVGTAIIHIVPSKYIRPFNEKTN